MAGRFTGSTVSGLEVFPIVAHEGGWDEILLVAGPLAVIALLLWLANRRVSARLQERSSELHGAGPTSGENSGADTP